MMDLEKKYIITLMISLALLVSSSQATATGVLPIIELKDDFNEANLIINVYNPPNIASEYKNNQPCSSQFNLILPQWSDVNFTEKQITIHDIRKFIFYNPETSSERVVDCRKFSAAIEPALLFDVSSENYLEPNTNKPLFLNIPFDWNLEKSNATCYLYNLPIYNPKLVNQSKTNYYPFDEYEMTFGFSFPYETDFQGLIRIPEKFKITTFHINTTQKGVTLFSTNNIGYYKFKSIKNETQMFHLKFSRAPDLGSIMLTTTIIFGLPILLCLFFICSSKPQKYNSKEHRITVFYIATLPLFIAMLPFLEDKPTGFTLFDVTMALSIGFLILNLLKDFIIREIEYKDKILEKVGLNNMIINEIILSRTGRFIISLLLICVIVQVWVSGMKEMNFLEFIFLEIMSFLDFSIFN